MSAVGFLMLRTISDMSSSGADATLPGLVILVNNYLTNVLNSQPMDLGHNVWCVLIVVMHYPISCPTPFSWHQQRPFQFQDIEPSSPSC